MPTHIGETAVTPESKGELLRWSDVNDRITMVMNSTSYTFKQLGFYDMLGSYWKVLIKERI